MMRSSLIFYQGPSVLDGSEIIGVLSGLDGTSSNKKTGNVVQSWILSAEQDPIKAAATGKDAAVCGDCELRHHKKGACYVVLLHGPQNIYHSAKSGNIPKLQDLTSQERQKLSRMLRKRPIRLGSYGDPAAVPAAAWDPILKYPPNHTGFTHQWQNAAAAWLKGRVMASVETRSAAAAAQAAGWKTSRTSITGKADRNETICLNKTVAAFQCDECHLCDGKSRNIVGPVSGSYSRRFTRADHE